MAYKRIGVFGATGLLGPELVRALVDEGFDVVPFSRQETTVAGVPTQQVGSLKGFDVIIGSIGKYGIGEQRPLIQRAKEDGVKRFIPSEFGFAPDTDGARSDFNKPKREIFQAVEEAGFPDGWTAIANGFMDFTIGPFATVDHATSTIRVRGRGDVSYPWTVRYDIGRVLAQTFRDPAAYKNTWLTVANEWLSLRDIADEINKKAGTSYEIVTVPADQTTPVLLLVEGQGLSLLHRETTKDSLPVVLSDIREYI